jgi:predicted O-methyltransferase YrrM
MLVEGWMKESELAWLYETARSLPPGSRVVEVGSWKGRSTVALCEGLIASTGSRLWAVDTFLGDPGVAHTVGDFDPEAVVAAFEANTADYETLTLLRAESARAAAAFEDGSLEWVFIDADHTYAAVVEDIRVWSPKLRPGGLISGHDFGLIDVTTAVTESFGRVSLGPGQVWFTRKRPSRAWLMTLRRAARRSIRG